MNRVATIALLTALTVPLAGRAYAGPSAPAGPAFPSPTRYDVYQMSCGHQPKPKPVPYCELSFGPVTVLDKPIARQAFKGFRGNPLLVLQTPSGTSRELWRHLVLRSEEGSRGQGHAQA